MALQHKAEEMIAMIPAIADTTAIVEPIWIRGVRVCNTNTHTRYSINSIPLRVYEIIG